MKKHDLKILALKDYFNIDEKTLNEYFSHETNLYSDKTSDYLILTEEEANYAVGYYIMHSLWAFSPEFLSSQTDVDEKIFQILQENLYEECNDFFLTIIEQSCGIQNFVNSAIQCDGRGHFLSTYDGKEEEVHVGDTPIYIYRI